MLRGAAAQRLSINVGFNQYVSEKVNSNACEENHIKVFDEAEDHKRIVKVKVLSAVLRG